MVCLQVEDSDFENLMNIYGELGYKYSIFRDSDLGNMLTAVAFEPMSKDIGDKYMGHLRLA